VSSQNGNNVAFRLPESHVHELNRLADQRGQSKGRLAKDIVMGALMDFGRFDEVNHRLGVIERALEHIIQRLDGLSAVENAIGRTHASLAMAMTRLLVEAAGADLAEAVAWSKEAFGVEEES